MMNITFETKCWENDWQFLLKKDHLDKMINNCNYPFDERILYINNVDNISLVKHYADKKVANNVIDRYVIVDEYANDTLTFFQIDKDSFKGGYYYSIAELVSIYLCNTDILLHFSSDSCLIKDDHEWVAKTSKLLAASDEYFVANPLWFNGYQESIEESLKETEKESLNQTEDNFIGTGFSDQCYMIRTADFKQPIYNETHSFSERYPKYGGELFEKRVDAYMRNHNKLRLTSKNTAYIHKNHVQSPSIGERFRTRMNKIFSKK